MRDAGFVGCSSIHDGTSKELFPSGFYLQNQILRLFVKLVGLGSTRLALSYAKVEDLLVKGSMCARPVLRDELFGLTPTSGDYILIYPGSITLRRRRDPLAQAESRSPNPLLL